MKKIETITIRTAKETKNELEKIALEEDRSISYIVDKIIQNYLKAKEEQNENRPA